MLFEIGCFKGDLIVFNWGDGFWWIMGFYYLCEWYMCWFEDYMLEGVIVCDLGEEICGFLFVGLNFCKVIERLMDGLIGDLKFMGCG